MEQDHDKTNQKKGEETQNDKSQGDRHPHIGNNGMATQEANG